MKSAQPNFIVVGLALFSMFFGSGNLIFSLMLGRDAGELFYISAVGFILSAVFIPFMGVLAIVKAQGDYYLIFTRFLGHKLGLILIFLTLLFFIPFGAAPRCVILAHASLKTFVLMPPLWLFSLIFLSIIGYLVINKNNLLSILGKVLTPILLVCLVFMVIFALKNGQIDPPLYDAQSLFFNSLFQGYNTQDLFSSLFFSSTLIFLIKDNFNNKKQLKSTLLKAGILGSILLIILYVFLMLASSYHNDILIGKSGIKLVSILARQTLGSFGAIASLAVSLACLTTGVALVLAFKDFLARTFKINAFVALSITLMSIFLTSLIKFEGITAIISPIMKVFYPVILVLVVAFLLAKHKIYEKSLG